jgi:NNP family nitrate/nitrite transporter-like MFS transporter
MHQSPLPDAARRGTDGLHRVRRLLSFEGRHRVLHLTWLAFFLSFVVWFNMAPFVGTLRDQLGLSAAQIGTLAICNVALTVPARIAVGMLLDRYGPRRVYAGILMFAALPCLVSATASSFEVLAASRLALGVVGAGFVVGIRMVAEWFPPHEVGTAEGVYGGWGNLGSAAAAFTLPVAAAWVGGPDGWRWSIAATGLIAAAYGYYYLRAVADTPPGRTYATPRRQGALEVTSRPAVWGLCLLLVPTVAVLGLIAWRVEHAGVLPAGTTLVLVPVLLAVLALQCWQVLRVNRPALDSAYPPEDRYPFRSVAILCVAYLCCFGSELAVVSMLPLFFADTWGLSPAAAGATAAAFAGMNLVARPAGGLLSDMLGSRRLPLLVLLGGLSAGYGLLSLVGPSWPLAAAVVAVMVCSVFVMSSEGAVFAVVPLVEPRVTGQIAGLAGAYGNIGAVCFLTVALFVPPATFFLVIAAASLVGTAACWWLPEPRRAAHVEPLVESEAPSAPEPRRAPLPAPVEGVA